MEQTNEDDNKWRVSEGLGSGEEISNSPFHGFRFSLYNFKTL